MRIFVCMKTMTVGEFKAQFIEVLEQVKAGIGFAVTYERKKKIYFPPEEQVTKRKIGLLEGEATVAFNPGYKITEESALFDLKNKL